MAKIKLFKPTSFDGNKLTDFGEYNISELKKNLRQTMNSIAEKLDEYTKTKIIEESKTVYALNNEIIRSVKGANRIVIKKMLYIIAVFVIFIAIVLALYFR